METDVIPIMDSLSTVSPDLHDLLAVSRELNEMLGGDDPDFMVGLVNEFLLDSENLMGRIRGAISRGSGPGKR